MPKHKILIIDKDKEFTDALTERLKTCKYIVASIQNGAAFHRVVSQFTPSILLLSDNIQNPVWGEMMTRIKNSQLSNKMAIFLTITQITPSLQQQLKIHTPNKVILKPFFFSEFIHQIDKIPVPS